MRLHFLIGGWAVQFLHTVDRGQEASLGSLSGFTGTHTFIGLQYHWELGHRTSKRLLLGTREVNPSTSHRPGISSFGNRNPGCWEWRDQLWGAKLLSLLPVRVLAPGSETVQPSPAFGCPVLPSPPSTQYLLTLWVQSSGRIYHHFLSFPEPQ